MSDPTALFAYGINLGDGSDYFLQRRDVFAEYDQLVDEDDEETFNGVAEFLLNRFAGFTEPEPDYDFAPNSWLAWSGRKRAAHEVLPVAVVEHGDSIGDTHLILAAKPIYRTDWNSPIPVPHHASSGPLFGAVSAAMATLGIESKEQPSWLLAAYGGR